MAAVPTGRNMNAADMLPLSGSSSQTYTWKEWDAPLYHFYTKRSAGIYQRYLRSWRHDEKILIEKHLQKGAAPFALSVFREGCNQWRRSRPGFLYHCAKGAAGPALSALSESFSDAYT
jgi:hypothetical protein